MEEGAAVGCALGVDVGVAATAVPGGTVGARGAATTAGAGAVAAHSVSTARRLEMLAIAEIDKGVQVFHRHRNHVTATPAVAAVGTAVLDIFLAAEADTAVATVTAFHENLGLIEEFHIPPARVLTENKKGNGTPFP